jgi:phosphotriesterase-related protein
MGTNLITTYGPISVETLAPGIILPHEHIFVDMRGADHPLLGVAEVTEVVALMGPELMQAKAAGVAAVVVCTPVGVGRRADFDRAVSHAAGVPVVVPTGLYREPWIPQWVHRASEAEITAWMVGELQEGIGQTGVVAGWIKLSAGDDGMTAREAKVLRAAAAAAIETGAVIGSHTIRGRVVRDQLAILESEGLGAERFIWVHTQAEPDVALHTEIARRGAWLEYDAIGSENDSDAVYIEHIERMLDAGFEAQLLLSHDRGWYDPAQPGGGTPRPLTYMSEVFLPKIAHLGEAAVDRLTRDNPFRAFAR